MRVQFCHVIKRLDGETHLYPSEIVLKQNSFNILLGATLAGKTTVLRLIAGLDKPSNGEIWFDDVNVTHYGVKDRNVAMVYQQFINYSTFNVFENIASPLRLKKFKQPQIDKRVHEVASLLGLSDYLQRMPNELSGGQQQRIALARALAKQSSLVLLDEPLVNLDYKLREQMREQLPQLFDHTGASVVYATTEPSEALLLGGYTAVMHEGRFIQYGRTHEVYHKPNSLQAAIEFSDPPINIFHVKKSQDRIYHQNHQWQLPDSFNYIEDGEYKFAVRAHHIKLANGQSEGFIVDGELALAQINGSETLLHVDTLDSSINCQLHGVHQFNEGVPIKLHIDPDHCMIFNMDGSKVKKFN